MNLYRTSLKELMNSEHPARNYILVAGAAIGIGVIRGRLSGLALVALGGFALSKAAKELHRTNGLHGGNFHGNTAPPRNSIEESTSVL